MLDSKPTRRPTVFRPAVGDLEQPLPNVVARARTPHRQTQVRRQTQARLQSLMPAWPFMTAKFKHRGVRAINGVMSVCPSPKYCDGSTFSPFNSQRCV
jgi:hypothetical protein